MERCPRSFPCGRDPSDSEDLLMPAFPCVWASVNSGEETTCHILVQTLLRHDTQTRPKKKGSIHQKACHCAVVSRIHLLCVSTSRHWTVWRRDEETPGRCEWTLTWAAHDCFNLEYLPPVPALSHLAVLRLAVGVQRRPCAGEEGREETKRRSNHLMAPPSDSPEMGPDGWWIPTSRRCSSSLQSSTVHH